MRLIAYDFYEIYWSISKNDLSPVQPPLELISNLPKATGVYIFNGDGDLPIYIGKSVDIRARVLSHYRAEDEARMMGQVKGIDFIETAGEIGALLLEARLIKEQSPLFNIRLRRLRHLCSIRLDKEQSLFPKIVSSRDVEVGKTEGLYGLFPSVHAAELKLRELANQHLLCLGLLGLEKISKRGCFALQLKQCLGACVGREDRAVHDDRLASALQELKVEVWPYDGAIQIEERQKGWTQRHRIDNWQYQGTWCSKSQQWSEITSNSFDLDTYKILVKPIMLESVTIHQQKTLDMRAMT